jgi:hypothetical protein
MNLLRVNMTRKHHIVSPRKSGKGWPAGKTHELFSALRARFRLSSVGFGCFHLTWIQTKIGISANDSLG